MGDRASIVIKDGLEQVALYTHSTGSDMPDVLRAALKFAQEKRRLDDAPYLARIIFCRMIPEEYWFDATLFGIQQNEAADGRTVYVNVDDQTVSSPRNDFDIPLTAIPDFISGPATVGDSDDEDEEEEVEA